MRSKPATLQVIGLPATVFGWLTVLLFFFGPLSAQVTFTWNTGDLLTILNPGTVTSGNTLVIDTTADHDFNSRAFVNEGTVNWNAGRLRSGGSGSITNKATWNDLGTATAGATTVGANAFKNDFGGSYTFTNATGATYAKSGTGTTIFQDVPFNNSGSVVVSHGTLILNGGGTSSGSFSAASGTIIRLANHYTIADGSNLTGAGTFESTGGTTTINGTVNVTNYQLAGATLAGTHTFTGGVTWSTGNMNTSGTTTNASGSTFTITGTNDHDFNSRALVNEGTVNWNAGRLRSGGSGSITNKATWNDLGIATAGATTVGANAFKNDFGGTYTFTNATGATYAKSGTGTTIFQDVAFNNAGTVLVQAGTLRLNGGGTSSGTVQVSSGAALDFTNNYAITNGSNLSGAGAYSLTGGTLSIDGDVNLASFPLNGGALAGTHTFAGAITWNGTNLSTSGTTTIASGATLTIATTADHDFNSRALINHGTIDWQAGRLRSGGSGSITNNATWNDLGTATAGATTVGANAFKNDFGGSYTFTNATGATYAKSGTGTTIFQDVPFNNSGSVVVSHGTLILNGGGTSSGSFSAASGSTIRLANHYTIADGSNLTGAGTFESTGGTTTINGTVNVTNYQLAGATLAGTHTFTGGVTWSTGNMNTSGTTTNASGSTFTITGTNDHDFNSRAFVNEGTVNWNAGRLRSGGSGSITNKATWNDLGTATAGATTVGANAFKNDFGGSYTFTNATGATYAKSGTGTTIFQDVPFNNSGSVVVSHGTLILNGGGTSSGSFSAASGTIIRLANHYTVADGSNLTGAGTFESTGGTTTINGTVNVTNYQLAGATLAGTHTFTGGVTWSTGNMNTSGTTTNASGSTFTITGTNDHDFNSRAFVNEGTVNWNAGRLRSGGSGSITNQATWNDLGTATAGATTVGANAFKNDFGGSYTFTNATGATYAKSGTGTTIFQDVAVTNHGSLTLAAGTLSFSGGLTLSASSRFLYTLSGDTPVTGYGLVNISGTLALQGSLDLDFGSGFDQSVAPTDSFTLLTASSLTGAFSNVANGGRLLTSDGLGSFQVNYGAGSAFAVNSVVISNFAAVPEPSTWALLILGGAALALAARRRT